MARRQSSMMDFMPSGRKRSKTQIESTSSSSAAKGADADADAIAGQRSAPQSTRECSEAQLEMMELVQESGWKEAVHPYMSKTPGRFERLADFVQGERKSNKCPIYPPQDEVFSALNLCPRDKVKVIILGQDPYHRKGQGHGLAFSVRRGVTIPPSLRNIYKEIAGCPTKQMPQHGCLESWAQQGVLLMNTVLTVREGSPNSHAKKGWEDFTAEVLRALLAVPKKHYVFLLWGTHAQKTVDQVMETLPKDSGHVMISSSHPSPLGATKTKSPFTGSRCFQRANEALISFGETPIDWSVPP